MGFKHRALPLDKTKDALAAPNFLLKIIPHVDGTPRICEIVRYHLTDIAAKGAWAGPATIELSPHALAPVADLPVLEVLSGVHIIADVTVALGTVVHDYLTAASAKPLGRTDGHARKPASSRHLKPALASASAKGNGRSKR